MPFDVWVSPLFLLGLEYPAEESDTVSVVVGIEILHMFFSTHTLYYMLVEGFGNPSVLSASPFSGAAMPALNGAGTYRGHGVGSRIRTHGSSPVGFCTQMFFVWRIVRLKEDIWGKTAACLVVLVRSIWRDVVVHG